MEAMLRMSMYSCLYLKLAKTLCHSYYLLGFLFNKIEDKEGRTGSYPSGGKGERRVEMVQTMYTQVSSYKNDTIKEKKGTNKEFLHQLRST
jgi:hypothetical protein